MVVTGLAWSAVPVATAGLGGARPLTAVLIDPDGVRFELHKGSELPDVGDGPTVRAAGGDRATDDLDSVRNPAGT